MAEEEASSLLGAIVRKSDPFSQLARQEIEEPRLRSLREEIARITEPYYKEFYFAVRDAIDEGRVRRRLPMRRPVAFGDFERKVGERTLLGSFEIPYTRLTGQVDMEAIRMESAKLQVRERTAGASVSPNFELEVGFGQDYQIARLVLSWDSFTRRTVLRYLGEAGRGFVSTYFYPSDESFKFYSRDLFHYNGDFKAKLELDLTGKPRIILNQRGGLPERIVALMPSLFSSFEYHPDEDPGKDRFVRTFKDHGAYLDHSTTGVSICREIKPGEFIALVGSVLQLVKPSNQ